MEESTLKPASDVHLSLLGDEGVLFSAVQQAFYALNYSAAFIWIQLEEGRTRIEIEQMMVAQLGVEPKNAAPQLDAIFSQWHDLGLLHDPVRQAPVKQGERDSVQSACGPGEFDVKSVTAERWYRLLDYKVRIRFSSAEQAAWVRPVLAHLACAGGGMADARIDIGRGDQGNCVFLDEELHSENVGIEEIAPEVKGYVRTSVARLHPHVVNLHAGIVGAGHECLLLPAVSGSGKSTLTAGLVHAGYSYLSDETALLEMPDMCVRPYHIALCSKSGSWPILEPLFPQLAQAAEHMRVDRKRVKYFFPTGYALADPALRYTITHVIFPRYVEGETAELNAISPVLALARMMNDCLAIPRWLEPDTVQALTRWAVGLQCYELVYGTLDDAITLIGSAWRPPQ